MRNTMLLAASAPFAIAAASMLPLAAQAQNVICKNTANADAGTIAPGKDNDVACGNNASITGDGSVAIGADTTAATRSTAVGWQASADDDSTAIGHTGDCPTDLTDGQMKDGKMGMVYSALMR